MVDEESAPNRLASLSRAIRDGDLELAAGLLARLGPLYALPPRRDDTGEGPEPAGAGATGALTDDGEFVPFYFTDPERAVRYGREHGFVTEADAGEPVARDPDAVIRDCSARGYGGVVLDPDRPEPVPLHRATIQKLVEELDRPGSGAADRAAAAADSGEDRPGRPELTPPPHAMDLADRVRRSPDLEAVPPPDVSPSACSEMLQELRELWQAGRLPAWELLDTLAFGMTFHVPVRPEPVEGLRWPLVARHPRAEEKPVVWIFTAPDHARRAMERLPDEVETVRLSGFEAFRWIWAAPARIEEILVDLYPGSPGPFSMPDVWALSALYPHFVELSDLDEVRRVELGEIGGLDGARGTKPECLRALVREWRSLLEVADADGGSPEPVEHPTGRFRPVFSGPDRYRAFAASRSGEGDEPAPVDPEGEAPFRRWLVESADCDGVILDPGGPHPLPLGHTALAVAAHWAEAGERPGGPDLVRAVLRDRDALAPRIAGRIVADWPRYFWALQPGEEERAPRAMTLPGRDACPVFSSEDRVRGFLDRVRDEDLVGPEMQALMYLTGWGFNVFREMHVRYREGGWIDPDPERIVAGLEGTGPPEEGDPGGLEVDEETLRSALARIEWRLQPRVPGFLVESSSGS